MMTREQFDIIKEPTRELRWQIRRIEYHKIYTHEDILKKENYLRHAHPALVDMEEKLNDLYAKVFGMNMRHNFIRWLIWTPPLKINIEEDILESEEFSLQ